MNLISFGNNSFALRYGKYAEDLECVGPSGGQSWKTILPVGVTFLCFVIGILFLSKGSPDPAQPEKPLSPLQQAMRVFGILLLITALGSLGFYGYTYFAKYLPEYYEWFDSLPSEAKTELALISFADKMLNTNNNNNSTLQIN